jgi:hypothetical protein
MAEEKHEQPHTPAPAKGARIPAAAVAAAYAPRVAGEGEDDASAEANSRIAADIASRANPPIPANQLVTEPTGMEGSRAMYIIVGPYRGQILTMPDAEAEDAKDSHWAVEMDKVAPPFDADTPFDHDHELTDEDRSYAIEAANAWAQAQYDPEEPAVEGEDETARASREKRNADRQAHRKPERKNETDEQRQAREKRNSDHNERQMRQQPRRAVEPKPAGTYETR